MGSTWQGYSLCTFNEELYISKCNHSTKTMGDKVDVGFRPLWLRRDYTLDLLIKDCNVSIKRISKGVNTGVEDRIPFHRASTSIAVLIVPRIGRKHTADIGWDVT